MNHFQCGRIIALYIFLLISLLVCSLTITQGAVFPCWVTQRQKQRLTDAIYQSGKTKIWTQFDQMGLPIDWGVEDDGRWSTGQRWEIQKMGRGTPRISICKSLRTRLFSHYQPIPWGYVTCIQQPRPRVRDWIPSVGWMKQEQAKVRVNRIRQEFPWSRAVVNMHHFMMCVCVSA